MANEKPASAAVAEALPRSDAIELHSGKDLALNEANDILAAGSTRLAVVAGPPLSGKTTLLTSLYEYFQEARGDRRLIFAGSKTLVGFEERCHLSREASEGDAPDTPRTLLSSRGNFLHLKICDRESPTLPRNLLLSDIVGEFFDDLQNSTDECKQHKFLTRADDLVLLLEGEKIVNLEYRNVVIENAKMLVRSLLDSGMLRPKTITHVVITKWDKVVAAKAESDANALANFTFHAFRAAFERRGLPLKFHKVAARPEHGSSLEYAFGMPGLFAELVSEWTRENVRPVRFEQTGEREADKFANRHFAMIIK